MSKVLPRLQGGKNSISGSNKADRKTLANHVSSKSEKMSAFSNIWIRKCVDDDATEGTQDNKN